MKKKGTGTFYFEKINGELEGKCFNRTEETMVMVESAVPQKNPETVQSNGDYEGEYNTTWMEDKDVCHSKLSIKKEATSKSDNKTVRYKLTWKDDNKTLFEGEGFSNENPKILLGWYTYPIE